MQEFERKKLKSRTIQFNTNVQVSINGKIKESSLKDKPSRIFSKISPLEYHFHLAKAKIRIGQN